MSPEGNVCARALLKGVGPNGGGYCQEGGLTISSFFGTGSLLKSNRDFARLGLTPRAVGIHGWTLDLLGTSSTKPKEGDPVSEHQLHGICYAAGGSGMSGLGKDEFGGSGSLSTCGRVSPGVCASDSEASPLTWREAPL